MCVCVCVCVCVLALKHCVALTSPILSPQLMPPVEDVDGNTTNCEPPDCSLHLHMDTTEYARLGVYSTESAPGIIVAHGEGSRHLLL